VAIYRVKNRCFFQFLMYKQATNISFITFYLVKFLKLNKNIEIGFKMCGWTLVLAFCLKDLFLFFKVTESYIFMVYSMFLYEHTL
jgi:hypothetical protein